MLVYQRKSKLLSGNKLLQKIFYLKHRCIFFFIYFSVFEGFDVYLGEVYVNYLIRSRPQSLPVIFWNVGCTSKKGSMSLDPDEANFS